MGQRAAEECVGRVSLQLRHVHKPPMQISTQAGSLPFNEPLTFWVDASFVFFAFSFASSECSGVQASRHS